tara:strand:- start:42 stop:308 length:267 start_codon:yes stop_codon:yes gene_type:complete
MGWIITTIILSIILTGLITSSFFMIRNLILKNEKLEDFISKQSEAINTCDKRLKEIDSKQIFQSDDEIGWFWEELKKIQEALNEFTLK